MADLGSLIIRVGGDPSGFKAAMADASDAADRFTSKITDSVSQGVTLFDAYGNTIQETTQKAAAGIEQLAAVENAASQSAERLAQAHAHAVTEIQATSGALRVFEGTGGIRAAERFIATTLGVGPALQAIFPIVGAIALIEQLAKVGEEVDKVAQNFFFMRDAEEAAQAIGLEMAKSAEKAIEHIAELQIASLREQGKYVAAAQSEMANLANKPIQLPNLSTPEQKKKLSGLNGEELSKIQEVYSEVLPADIPARIKEINDGIVRTSDELQAIEKSGFDPTFLNTHYANQSKVALELYGDALQFLQIKQQEFTAETQKASSDIIKAHAEEAQKRQEAANKAAEVIRKQQSDLKSGYDAMLADLETADSLTTEEKIQFRERELAEIQQSGDKFKSLQREIQREIGKLYQQSFAELERAREKDLKDEQHYQESLASTRAHFAKEAAEQAKKRNEEAKNEIKITVPLQSRIAGPLADVIALDQAGLKTIEIQESQILREKVLLDLARQFDVPLGDQYAFKEKILGAEIALGEKTGQNISAQLIGLASVKYAQEKLRQQADGIATVYLKIKSEFDGLVGNLGSAISSGIFSGRGIAAAITDSLKHAGQQILGGVFQQAINRLVAELGINRAVTAALNAIMGVHTGATTANTATLGAHIGAIAAHAGVMLSHLGVMVTHIGVMIGTTAATIANTAATILNTFWLAIKSAFSFLGFADGGSPPIGVPSIVGERGPEIIVPRGPVSVLPNSAFRAALGSNSGVGRGTVNNTGGNNITINVNGAVSPKETVRQIARYMKTAGGPQFSPAS